GPRSPALDALRSVDDRARRGDPPHRAGARARRDRPAAERPGREDGAVTLVVARGDAVRGDATAVLLRRGDGREPRQPAPPRAARRRRATVLRPPAPGARRKAGAALPGGGPGVALRPGDPRARSRGAVLAR